MMPRRATASLQRDTSILTDARRHAAGHHGRDAPTEDDEDMPRDTYAPSGGDVARFIARV